MQQGLSKRLFGLFGEERRTRNERSSRKKSLPSLCRRYPTLESTQPLVSLVIHNQFRRGRLHCKTARLRRRCRRLLRLFFLSRRGLGERFRGEGERL